jgi:hypothetical protein
MRANKMKLSDACKLMYSLTNPFTRLILFVSLMLANSIATGVAAEYGKSVYPPGFRGSMAGFVPPPGTYLGSVSYYYSGSVSGDAAVSRSLDHLGGDFSASASIKADAITFIEIPNVLWVAPDEYFGGKLGLGAFIPIGYQDVSVGVGANAALNIPRLGLSLQSGHHLSATDQTIAFGDPLLMAMLGWDADMWHWNLSGTLNIPIGEYDRTNLANIGFNHWALDTTLATTWLDPVKGYEVSVSAGVTLNAENPDTNYKSGAEFHLEFAVMKHFLKAFSAGLAGYHYQQLTGDSGSGAILGDFKGRVSALGPSINYNFKIGNTPVFSSFRWLHEFNVDNRMEGDTVLLSLTIPLGGAAHH